MAEKKKSNKKEVDELRKELEETKELLDKAQDEINRMKLEAILNKDKLAKAEEEIWDLKQKLNYIKADNADMNGDGKATLKDVWQLLKRVFRGNLR